MLVLSASSMKSKAFDTLHKSVMYNKNALDLKSTPGALHIYCIFRESFISIQSSVQTEF